MGARKRGRTSPATGAAPRLDRSPPWDVVYYAEADGKVPAIEFLDACPTNVEATLVAVLDAVANAPPPQFSGGGKWEAMHGTMAGYHEVRVTGPSREQFRLFCILENGSDRELTDRGFAKPTIAVITGMRKPNGAVFSDDDYRSGVRRLGERHRAQLPRRIAN